MKNEWYEIAVSYTDDGGTETIESKDSLKEAITYAENCDELKLDDVEFIFIDRWYYDKDKYGDENHRYEESAIIIDKERYYE